MCGIAGIWGSGGDIRRMTEVIAHRGPDDEGYLEEGNLRIGSRRLAVIDPENARQPMTSPDGRVSVVFNGTIYNFRELRTELDFPFRTDSDTEVVLAAYVAWGTDCFRKFNGMFSIAIRDGQRLVLARDRFGEKPLYWTRHDGRFLFSSEVKALLEEVPAVPRIQADFAALETAVGDRTLFEGIFNFPTASYAVMEHSDDTLTPHRYWDLPPAPSPESPSRSRADLVDELRHLLRDAIELRMIADVPVGLFLSGGLDSAIIAAIARPERVYSCHFAEGPGYEEIEHARTVAKAIGAEHIVVEPTWQDLRDHLPRIIRHLDFPVATPSPIAENALARRAREDVKVVLGGQGADECFGGYVRYLFVNAEQDLAAQPELKSYGPMARHFWGENAFGDPADRYIHMLRRGAPLPPDLDAWVRSLFDRGGDLADRMGHVDLHFTLPSLLTMNDRAAAAEGLENRCPLLDHRIVEFAFSLPPGQKIQGFRTKHILREAVRDIVPDSIIDRRDKMGLITPVNRWLRGPLAAWAQDLAQSLESRGLHLDRKSERGEFDRNLYTRVCLELWHREYIDS